MAMLIELILLVVMLLFLYVLFRVVKSLTPIILNSVAGIVCLFLLNYFFHLGIPIDFWTIVTVGLGGFVGLLVILIFHFLGIAF